MRISLHACLGLIVTASFALGGCGSGDDGANAKIRLLNVSTGYDSLDLYTNNGDQDNDQLKIEATAFDTVSSYVGLDSDTYTIKLKRNGITSSLETLSGEKLADDSHLTYVAYGSSGHFALLSIDEDVSDPDGGNVKVQVLNASEAGSVDVYLTADSDSLDDASPAFSSAASGSGSSVTTLDSGTYRLRVTGAGDTTDLRLDVSDITLDSKGVYAIILTATQGGVLVNAMILPQRGSLTSYANTKARVRGAVGISNGTSVIAKIGGVSLLSGSTVGVISSTYQQVAAGSQVVVLSVDGTQVTVANQTLTAGADYTFLIWNDANGTQTTLVSDDNRLPTSSSTAKVRILNGLSGLGNPVTLYVDYSPVAEGTVLGQASAAAESTSGTDYQIDVSATDTGASLYSSSSVTLQDSGVYTLFVSGGGTVAVKGTLRKDR